MKIAAIAPATKLDLLIALQNLSFMLATTRMKGAQERTAARRMFLQLARRQAQSHSEQAPEASSPPVYTFTATEQILIAVLPGRA